MMRRSDELNTRLNLQRGAAAEVHDAIAKRREDLLTAIEACGGNGAKSS